MTAAREGEMDRFTLHLGDCREVMAAMDAESVDAIVSDPPYGLSFMGKGWDHGVPNEEFWLEALRVAKPGAHLVAFGGTRTYHRLACAIEDAGWEIRDCLMWVHGQGFPKSHDVSKAMDKAAGAERRVVGQKHVTNAAQGRGLGHGNLVGGKVEAGWIDVTAPATDLARRWEGWGTALKPAWEPIILARKPLVGTVAENVARYGTGALNVDGCRVDGETIKPRKGGFSDSPVYGSSPGGVFGGRDGRWPANVVHDGSQMVLDLFPPVKDESKSAARFFYCAKASKRDRDAGLSDLPEATPGQRTERKEGSAGVTAYAGGRGPARNVHPTVKPTDLMRWLVRLVAPPGGVVLDPFMGSGSTGKAAILEGARFVGIDITPEYLEIARRRIGHAAREGGDGA
jgi:DNA modification methylase